MLLSGSRSGVPCGIALAQFTKRLPTYTYLFTIMCQNVGGGIVPGSSSTCQGSPIASLYTLYCRAVRPICISSHACIREWRVSRGRRGTDERVEKPGAG